MLLGRQLFRLSRTITHSRPIRQYSSSSYNNTQIYKDIIGFSVCGCLSYGIYQYIRPYDDDDWAKMKEKQLKDIIRLIDKNIAYPHALSKTYDENLAPTIGYSVLIKDLPSIYVTNDLIINMIKARWYNIECIPEQYHNQELFDKIIKINNDLRYIPEQYRSNEVCEYSVNYYKNDIYGHDRLQ